MVHLSHETYRVSECICVLKQPVKHCFITCARTSRTTKETMFHDLFVGSFCLHVLRPDVVLMKLSCQLFSVEMKWNLMNCYDLFSATHLVSSKLFSYPFSNV